jgi:peptide chain release factor 1
MIPAEKIKKIINNYELLEKDLASEKVSKKDFVQKSKEYSNIGEIINEARGYLAFEKEKIELEKIINDKKGDKEMIELAKNELDELTKKKKLQEKALKLYLLPKDEADAKNAILEIRAGTGGLEATLFVADLYKMYEKVCLNNRWSFEIINISKSDAGGFKEVILLIKGKNIYSFLKYESGVHRVQRVPETETQGRVHTSAATVAVLPEAEEVDVKINEKDLRIDVFRSSGPGGQSVNTTDSAVRITHLPTGIVVSQQDEKSQHRNREKGMKILRSRVYEAEREKKEKERSKERKNQIGTGDRSERIRTYNFPQGRVTDHRINLTLHKLDEFLSGDAFEELTQNLRIQDQEIKLANLGNK